MSDCRASETAEKDVGFRRGRPSRSAVLAFLLSLGMALGASAQTSISSIEELQKIGNDPGYPLNGSYVLSNNIDASDTVNWNGGAGFAAVGPAGSPFTGLFDGQGFVISGLFINRPSGANIGLFGYIQGGVVQNVGLEDAEVMSNSQVGMLAGYLKTGTISNCTAAGSATGQQFVGGLVGLVEDTVSNSHASGEVSGSNGTGGLVGLVFNGTISNCYATADVSGQVETGGLVGYQSGGTISTCYATGTVTGSQNVAGLTGSVQNGSTVSNSYATGRATGDFEVGGLVGLNYGSITRCYASGRVTGTSGAGGLAADGFGSVTESFWDLGTVGTSTSAGGTGLSTAAMVQQASFNPPWDFTSVWTIVEGDSYPYLRNNAQNPPPDPAPHAIAITPASAGPTNADSVDFTVEFDEDVVNFNDAADVAITHTGTAHTGVSISGSGSTYTVTVNGITGNGSFTLAADTSSDIESIAGNALASSVTSAALAIDNIAPTVSIGSVMGSPVSVTGTASFPLLISGAGSVSLGSGNVTLNHSGTAGGTITILNGTSSTPSVQVTGVTGDGSYTISIAAGVASDAAGNLSAAAGPSASAAVVDNTGPTVSIGTPTGSPVNSSKMASFPITITGASSVSLSNFHVSLQHTGTFGGTISILNGSTTTPTVRVTGVSGNGSYTISLASGIASDALDNTSAAAGPSASVTVDNTVPTLGISAPSPSLTAGGPVTYTVTYAGASTITLDDADVTLIKTGSADGTVSVAGTGTTTRTITISSITGDGTLRISFPAGTAADAAGNLAPPSSPTSPFAVDNTPPVVSIGAPVGSPVNSAGTATFPVMIAGAAGNGFDPGDVTISHNGTAGGSVIVLGDTTATPSLQVSGVTGDGSYTVGIAAGIAYDAAGNTSAASGASSAVTVDNTAPSFSSLTVTPEEASVGEEVTITFVAGEPLPQDPEVAVNGNPATRTGKSTGYTYTYTVQPTDAGGPASVDVSGVDSAGNLGSFSSSILLTILEAATLPLHFWPALLAFGAAGGWLLRKRGSRY